MLCAIHQLCHKSGAGEIFPAKQCIFDNQTSVGTDNAFRRVIKCGKIMYISTVWRLELNLEAYELNQYELICNGLNESVVKRHTILGCLEQYATKVV